MTATESSNEVLTRVPVTDGTVLCRTRVGSSRPVLFVPGWGAEYAVFEGLSVGLSSTTTLSFLESREKQSSNLSADASFRMRQFAADVAAAVKALDLAGRDYVLAGTCFGAAVCMDALARSLVRPSVTLLFDPMPRMWVPRWVLSATPLLPVPFIAAVRPFARNLLLNGMAEVAQRDRTRRIIDGADLRKWKRGSYALRDWSAFAVAGRIGVPVHVYNGSSDRFHSADNYPRVAARIPTATFLGFTVDESERERFMGRVVSEYANGAAAVIPDRLREGATRIIESAGAAELSGVEAAEEAAV